MAKPTSPTAAAPAFAGNARIGNANAARISALAPSIAPTAAAADGRAAARRFLRRVGLLERLRRAGIAVERHVLAGEIAALVGSDIRAGGESQRERAAGELDDGIPHG